ncbi:hypothetical protein HGRIS_013009 [Hohenbuehelia grisea]|uniref:F-box domain-containing protein n=1 Tax=Hohenbuehelia grisea TaxID=104357 RepID=A0ABR3IUE1_9AGAR
MAGTNSEATLARVLQTTRAGEELYHSFFDISSTSDTLPTPSEASTIRSHIDAIDSDLLCLDTELLRINSGVKSDSADAIRNKAYEARARLMSIISPLRRIPPELLAYIFKLSSDGFLLAEGQSLWPICGVSRRWRCVALSDATLWSNIYHSGSEPEDFDEHTSYRLNLCMQRSAQAPLSVVWWHEAMPLPPVVAAESSRFRALSGYRGAFAPLRKGSMPMLEYLEIREDEDELRDPAAVTDVFADAPRLREICIRQCQCASIQLPFLQIQKSMLCFISPHHMREFLLRLPGLLELKFVYQTSSPYPHLAPVHLSNLAVLDISDPGQILECLYLPNLTELRVRPRVQDGMWPRLISLVVRSACKLQKMSLESVSASQISQLLAVAPFLESLELKCRRVHTLLPCLATCTANAQLLAPRLKVLQFSIHDRYDTEEPISALLDCLESRFAHCDTDVTVVATTGAQLSSVMPLQRVKIIHLHRLDYPPFPPNSTRLSRLQRLISKYGLEADY